MALKKLFAYAIVGYPVYAILLIAYITIIKIDNPIAVFGILAFLLTAIYVLTKGRKKKV